MGVTREQYEAAEEMEAGQKIEDATKEPENQAPILESTHKEKK